MPGRLDRDTFASHLGEPLTLQRADEIGNGAGADPASAAPREPIDAVLEACDSLMASPGAPRQDPFAISVRVAAGSNPSQGTYLVSGAGLDETAIFFVPVGTDAEGRVELHAIFN